MYMALLEVKGFYAMSTTCRGQQRNFGPLYNPKIWAPPSFGATADHPLEKSEATLSMLSIPAIIVRKYVSNLHKQTRPIPISRVQDKNN